MWEGCLFDIMAQGMGGYLEKSAYYSITGRKEGGCLCGRGACLI